MSESIGGVVDIVVDGVCEPIAQWRVSASEPKAREREKVEKNSLGGVVDIAVDGVRTNCKTACVGVNPSGSNIPPFNVVAKFWRRSTGRSCG